MSDLIIKDMEMPENCNECFCLDMFDDDIYGRQYFCGILGIDALAKEHSRHKNCPLSEIPTPHGRLIDADRLIRRLNGIEYIANAEGGRPTFSEVLEEIAKAPTIIEEEETE